MIRMAIFKNKDFFSKLAARKPDAVTIAKQTAKTLFTKPTLTGAAASAAVHVASIGAASAINNVFSRAAKKTSKPNMALAQQLARKFEDTYNLGRVPLVPTKDARVPSSDIYKEDGKVKYRILVPVNPDPTKAQIDDPAVYLHELGHIKGHKERSSTFKALRNAREGYGWKTGIITAASTLGNAPNLGSAVIGLMEVPLVVEEWRASKDALKFLSQNAPKEESARARKLLKSLHNTYVVSGVQKAVTPFISSAVFSHVRSKMMAKKKK